METCNASAFAENGGTDRHHVPHFLPGQNTALTEWLKNAEWVPVEATRGGAKTIYPEYRGTLNGGNAANLKVPLSKSSNDVAKRIADQAPHDGQVHVLPVQGNVYMLIADGTNLTMSVGNDGVLLVDTGSAQMTDKVLAAVNQVANNIVSQAAANTCTGAGCPGAWGWASPYMNAVISSPAPPRPLRYIINSNALPDRVGGNERIATTGYFPRGSQFGGAVENVGPRAFVIAHENVLNRMSAPAGKQSPTPTAAWPTDTYFDEFQKLPEYVNGEAVIVYHTPAANTDGDSFT
jgi:glyoxylase-like metal-dependent hydrolase (beta-lactamase superfamily II)